MRRFVALLLLYWILPLAADAGDAKLAIPYCVNLNHNSPSGLTLLVGSLNYQFVVTRIACASTGSTPSVTATMTEGDANASNFSTTIEAAVTCDADGGVSTAIDAPTIEANNWMEVIYGTQSGTVANTAVSVCGYLQPVL